MSHFPFQNLRPCREDGHWTTQHHNFNFQVPKLSPLVCAFLERTAKTHPYKSGSDGKTEKAAFFITTPFGKRENLSFLKFEKKIRVLFLPCSVLNRWSSAPSRTLFRLLLFCLFNFFLKFWNPRPKVFSVFLLPSPVQRETKTLNIVPYSCNYRYPSLQKKHIFLMEAG